MTQAAVADPHDGLPEFVHHSPDDAGAGKNDVGALRLKTDDRATLRRVAQAIQLDLAVDLGSVQHSALYDIGIVGLQTVLDGSDVGNGAAHGDKHIRGGAAVDPRQILADGGKRVAERVGGNSSLELST